MMEDYTYAVGPSVAVPLRELLLYAVLSLSNICIGPSKSEAATHKGMVGENFEVVRENPIERTTLVMLMGLLEIVKLGIEIGSPVEPMMLVLLNGPIGLGKIGGDIGSPVEPMMLVILTELKGAVEGTPVMIGLDVKFE